MTIGGDGSEIINGSKLYTLIGYWHVPSILFYVGILHGDGTLEFRLCLTNADTFCVLYMEEGHSSPILLLAIHQI
jgi:hypothetical protein